MNSAFVFGPFLLCPGARMLLQDGVAISIGSRAFDILVALVKRRGSVLSHRELLALAWPGLVVEDANLRVQIQSLRRSLGCARKDERFIVSVPGRGYCFVALANEVKLSEARHASHGEAFVGKVATRSPEPLDDQYVEAPGGPSRPSQKIPKAGTPDQAQGGSGSSSIGLEEAGRALNTDLIILLARSLFACELHLTEDLGYPEKLVATEYKQMIPEVMASLVRYGSSGTKLLTGHGNDRSEQHPTTSDDLKRLKEAVDILTARLLSAPRMVH
jgi:DNA-binding winged helix-turn-helix (wHTH) protein